VPVGDGEIVAVADGVVDVGAVLDGEAVVDGEGDEDADADVLGDGEGDGDADADVLGDGDVLPDGEPDADEEGDDDAEGEADADADGELPGVADLVGCVVADVLEDGGTGGFKKLDRDGVRYAFGATETEGVADDDPRGVAGAFDTGAGAVATAPVPACGWACLAGSGRLAPIMAKTATAETATSPPLRHAEASDREMRCRPGRPPPPAGVGPEADPVSARRFPAPTGTAGPTGATADRSAVKLLMIDSASQPGVGWMAPTSASSSRAVGRSPGCLARQLPISGRSSPGTLPRRGGLSTSRYMSAAFDPDPNGPWPVAAKARTAPRLNMSLAGPMSEPRICSGDMNLGEPIIRLVPAARLASAASEIPKSMTLGPSSASRTLEGLRSRCTTPAA
jgi:hypothetical protein